MNLFLFLFGCDGTTFRTGFADSEPGILYTSQEVQEPHDRLHRRRIQRGMPHEDAGVWAAQASNDSSNAGADRVASPSRG